MIAAGQTVRTTRATTITRKQTNEETPDLNKDKKNKSKWKKKEYGVLTI